MSQSSVDWSDWKQQWWEGHWGLLQAHSDLCGIGLEQKCTLGSCRRFRICHLARRKFLRAPWHRPSSSRKLLSLFRPCSRLSGAADNESTLTGSWSLMRGAVKLRSPAGRRTVPNAGASHFSSCTAMCSIKTSAFRVVVGYFIPGK